MTNERKFPSESADKIMLRFYGNVKRDVIKQRAARNRRSMNSEILSLIESGLNAEQPKENAPESEGSDALMQ